MIPEEMLSEEVLRQAAEQYVEAIIASLPAPIDCNHKFSKRFEEKIQSLINGVGTNCFSMQYMIRQSANRLNGGLILFQIAVLLFRYVDCWLIIFR